MIWADIKKLMETRTDQAGVELSRRRGDMESAAVEMENEEARLEVFRQEKKVRDEAFFEEVIKGETCSHSITEHKKAMKLARERETEIETNLDSLVKDFLEKEKNWNLARDVFFAKKKKLEKYSFLHSDEQEGAVIQTINDENNELDDFRSVPPGRESL